MFITIRI